METCIVTDCSRDSFRRGYCSPHYQRQMKYGDPLAGGIFRDMDRQGEACIIDGCDKHRYARRWCQLHWGRWQSHGDPLWLPIARVISICSVVDCGEDVRARGYCTAHYGKLRRHGDPLFQSTVVSRRKNSKQAEKGGYVRIYFPEHPNARKDGYVSEHTVVVSESIGRPLTATENVHHRNGVRDDNRIQNLELWNKAQPAGKRARDLIEYANEIHSLYGTDPTKYP